MIFSLLDHSCVSNGDANAERVCSGTWLSFFFVASVAIHAIVNNQCVSATPRYDGYTHESESSFVVILSFIG